MALILALKRQSQVDFSEFKANLVSQSYVMRKKEKKYSRRQNLLTLLTHPPPPTLHPSPARLVMWT